MTQSLSRSRLDQIYETWNRQCWIAPDPLEAVLHYSSAADREAAAFVAASMAYGRVASVLKALWRLLGFMGKSPAEYLSEVSAERLERDIGGMVYRFASASHLAALITPHPACTLESVRFY